MEAAETTPGGLPTNSLVRGRTDDVNQQSRDHIRVDVGVWPAVFDVALAVLLHLPRDTDGRTAIGYTV